jgi:hypothetical protein
LISFTRSFPYSGQRTSPYHRDCSALFVITANTISHAQYVRRANRLGLWKYTTRKNSPYRAVEKSAQDALQMHLAPSSTDSLYEPQHLENSGQEKDLTYIHHHEDSLKSASSNHATYPIRYAPSTSEAQNEPRWSRVGNAALLMEEDMYITANTYIHTQSGPNVSPSESMIPFGPHITSGVPVAVTGPSSIDIHRSLEMPHVPYTHSGEDIHYGNTANNTWHLWQRFGTYDQSPLIGSGLYDNDADDCWRY